ncbi:MAG: serine hydrolase domain-containing protein [Planctomycetota bacterium]
MRPIQPALLANSVLLLGLVSFAGAPRCQVSVPRRFADVRAVVADAVGRGVTPGLSIAVVADGELVWAEGFGEADRERGRPATPDTVYRVGWAVAEACVEIGVRVATEQGLVRLGAAVNEYLGETPLQRLHGAADRVTVRHVLERRAGLPEHWSYRFDTAEVTSFAAVLRSHGFAISAASLTARRRPSAWTRDDPTLGVGLLAHVVARVADASWDQFLVREVFGPMGMERTGVVGVGSVLNDLAMHYRVDDEEYTPLPAIKSAIPGAASLRSSVRDLAQLLRAALPARGPSDAPARTPLSASLRATAQQLRSLVPVDERTSLRKCGSMPGGSALLVAYPEHRAGLAVLTNSAAGPLLDQVWDAFRSALEPDRWNTAVGLGGGVPGRPAAAGHWAGTWRIDGEAAQLVVPEEPSAAARIRLGAREAVIAEWQEWGGGLSGFSGRFDGDAPIPGRSAAGAPSWRVHLELDENSLYGVLLAVADGHYTLAYPLELRRDE